MENDDAVKAFVKKVMKTVPNQRCPDCGVFPNQPHIPGCDMEYCTVCGEQRMLCNCENHDPKRARWLGYQ